MTELHSKKSQTFALVIIGLLFFIFGFVTWLNSVLIPFLKISCELTLTQAFFVATAFYIAYFVMAIPLSFILKKIGFVNSMSFGLMIMMIGTLIFIPAAYMRQYWVFLVGLFIQGTGLTMLQTASNPYVALLGPVESAAKRISIMGVANKLAGAISTIVFGIILLSKTEAEINSELSTLSGALREDYLNELAQKVIGPYLLITAILLVLALLVRLARLPEISKDEIPAERFNLRNIPKYAWLGIVAIFFYVGAEVIVGDSIISYGRYLNLDAYNLSVLGITINLLNPNLYTLYVMLSMIIGYLIGIILIPKVLKQTQALLIFTISAIVFAIAAVVTYDMVSLIFIILLGISNSIMWPAIWPLAIEKTGSKTPVISAMLIMGIVGGALLSPAFGQLADVWNMHQAYWILLPCYLYILFFAVKGHTLNKPMSDEGK